MDPGGAATKHADDAEKDEMDDEAGDVWDLGGDGEEAEEERLGGHERQERDSGETGESSGEGLGDWDEILNLEDKLFKLGLAEGREIGAAREQEQAKVTGRQKGAEFGLELGFYFGVVETLKEIVTNPQGEIADALRAEGDVSQDSRCAALAGVHGKLDKPGVAEVLATLQELLQEYPVGAGFDDDVHAKFLRIRAKFKVLEARLGLTFDITPPLQQVPSTAAQGSALDAASLEF
ncbi:Oral cancer-overexpressed protein 1-like [Hondaea fermentalgiana]|uniref:Oral cancer-overexpressed protein 1-like n=1 Tax=Hondaea fermentalgiana TaxID=2315210 RepID=A0A2R5GK52_9STRA|nr:Oral cancer-overexpressed protein 1-like [Hondaea fermentalgiana]|eukprot:GBG30699.1 Oral cancer-overexpressed protein 1-like [Hondaea fermentalgiana]